MSHLRRPVIAAIALLAAGCSASRYEADYAKALENYRSDAPLAILQPVPAELSAGRLQARLPQGFAPVASGGEDVGPIDPCRLRPRFLESLAGFEGTFERWLGTDAAKVPASVAVWLLPAGDGPRAALEKSLLDKVRGDEAFQNTSQAWEDRQVVPKAGGPAAWRVLSLAGSQLFESTTASNPEYKHWDSTCELWLSADPVAESRTLLVWRVPTQVAGELAAPPGQIAETVARTISHPAPAAAEPAPPAAGGAAGF